MCVCLYVLIHAHEPMLFFLLVNFSGPLASMKCPRVHGSILKICLASELVPLTSLKKILLTCPKKAHYIGIRQYVECFGT